MAESMSATLSGPSNVISGQPATFVVTLKNSGDVSATLNNIQFYVPPPAVPCDVGAWTRGPNAVTTVASGGGTLSIPFQVTFWQPNPGVPAALPSSCPSVCVNAQTAAGSVFSPVPLVVAIALANGNVPPVVGGVCDFSNRNNSALIL